MRSSGRIVAVVLIAVASAAAWAADVVDPTTIQGKVMCGYQAWFRCGPDGLNLGWVHWSRDRNTPVPGTLCFEMWPDFTDCTSSELYTVPGFSYPDGSQAKVYDADNALTVQRHFEWMRDYGLDGAYVQHFLVGFPGGADSGPYASHMQIIDDVVASSQATGRVWALSYDAAGEPLADIYDTLIADWKKMVDSGYTSGPRYLHANGLPVLQFWGCYYNNTQDQMTAAVGNQILDFLKAPGPYQAYVVGGGEWDWRSINDASWQSFLARFDGYIPWNIGNYVNDAQGIKHASMSMWPGDIAACAARNQLWMPTVYPGFSWDNLQQLAPGTSLIWRNGGKFLWEQYYNLAQLKQTTVFVSMFDEVDEGTAIYKVSSAPPTQAHFVGYDGFPSDWYLRLTGTGIQMLRGQAPLSASIPFTPSTAFIGIRFQGTAATPMAFNEVAGAAPQANWNNVGAGTGGATGSNVPLNDCSGANSGATISWTGDHASSNTDTAAGDTAGNYRLMKGYLSNANNTPATATVTVAGLPAALAAGYDVIVYVNRTLGTPPAGGTSDYSIGAVTQTISDNADFAGTFTLGNNGAGNYVYFSNVTGTSFTLLAQGDGTQLKAPINAIQIMPVAISAQAAAPTISPNGGTFTAPTVITLVTATAAANINYTLDGTTPSDTNGIPYTGPFTLAASATVQAIAFGQSMTDSTVSSAVFSIDLPPYLNGPPAVSPNPVDVNQPVSVSVSATDPDGASVSVTFDWGDGSADTPGPTAQHTYTSSGTFTLTITLSDGVNTVVDNSTTISVVPGSPPPTPTPFTVSKLSGTLNFKSPNLDTVALRGMLPAFPKSEVFTHQRFTVTIGNVPVSFEFGTKLSTQAGFDGATLKPKLKKGVYQGGPVPFSVKLKGNFSNVFTLPLQPPGKTPLTVALGVAFDNLLFAASAKVNATKRGNKAAFK